MNSRSKGSKTHGVLLPLTKEPTNAGFSLSALSALSAELEVGGTGGVLVLSGTGGVLVLGGTGGVLVLSGVALVWVLSTTSIASRSKSSGTNWKR